MKSDEDVLTATQLAERAKREGRYKRGDLAVYDDDRIFVQSNSNEKFGLLRSSSVSALEAITFMTIHLRKRSYTLTSLNIPGMSRPQ